MIQIAIFLPAVLFIFSVGAQAPVHPSVNQRTDSPSVGSPNTTLESSSQSSESPDSAEANNIAKPPQSAQESLTQAAATSEEQVSQAEKQLRSLMKNYPASKQAEEELSMGLERLYTNQQLLTTQQKADDRLALLKELALFCVNKNIWCFVQATDQIFYIDEPPKAYAFFLELYKKAASVSYKEVIVFNLYDLVLENGLRAKVSEVDRMAQEAKAGKHPYFKFWSMRRSILNSKECGESKGNVGFFDKYTFAYCHWISGNVELAEKMMKELNQVNKITDEDSLYIPLKYATILNYQKKFKEAEIVLNQHYVKANRAKFPLSASYNIEICRSSGYRSDNSGCSVVLAYPKGVTENFSMKLQIYLTKERVRQAKTLEDYLQKMISSKALDKSEIKRQMNMYR